MYKGLGAPNFYTNRLYCRPIDLCDIRDMYEICNNRQVTKYLTFEPHRSTLDTKHVIENMIRSYYSGNSINYAIIQKDTNKMIGSASITFNLYENSAEIGYLLNQNSWNQGYMSEVIKAIVQIAFEYYHLNCLYAKHILENEASKKIILANHFKLMQVNENSFLKNNHLYTILEYKLNYEDFIENKKA